jgi:hypothetical protein
MRPGDQRKINIVLAGIQAGILGGLAMLVWLAMASLWNGRSIWSIANLLGSTFYGEAAFRRGFRWPTATGLAFHFVLAAVVGIVFGFVVSGVAGRTRVMLMGLFFGLAWYYLSFGLLWNLVNKRVPLYGTGASMVLAHVLFGTFLGRTPRYRSALEDVPPVASDGSPPDQGASGHSSLEPEVLPVVSEPQAPLDAPESSSETGEL